jgi:hypothetical protein
MEKSFITLATGVNVVKLFSPPLMMTPKELERLFLQKFET